MHAKWELRGGNSGLFLTEKVLILVPPSWLEKPSNREVTLGHKVELPCRADGAPLPKITWKKEIGETANLIISLGVPICFFETISGPYLAKNNTEEGN